MGSLGNFGKRMKKRAKQLEVNLNKNIRATALAIDSALVFSTPVDTGRARANWQVSVGAPITTTQPAPGSPEQGINNALTQAKSSLTTRQPEETIYITNNLDYIGSLNQGSSAQAPAGFVESAVQAGQQAIKNSRVFK